jgi:hypothetical protein
MDPVNLIAEDHCVTLKGFVWNVMMIREAAWSLRRQGIPQFSDSLYHGYIGRKDAEAVKQDAMLIAGIKEYSGPAEVLCVGGAQLTVLAGFKGAFLYGADSV